MPIRYERPVSIAARFAGRFGLFAATMVFVVFLAHRFGPLSTPDFLALVLVSAIPAALAVPLGLIGLARLWYVGAYGGIAAARGLVCSLVPLFLVALALFHYLSLPPLYDVSTDLVEPPRWIVDPEADQKWLPPRPPVTPLTREAQLVAYPTLTGRRYEGALDRVYEAVQKVARQEGFRLAESRGERFAAPDIAPLAGDTQDEAGEPAPDIVPDVGPVPVPRPDEMPTAEPEPGEQPGVVRLQATVRSFIFGFPFDVMIRLREEAETTLVDMRVASRYGPHDLGFGSKIAEQFLRALDAELLGIAGD